jgi:hypothetical protein
MRRSWSRRNLVLAAFCLICLLGSALSVASCGGRGPGTTQATVSATSGATQTTTAAGGDAGRISADNVLFRDDFQDGDTEGWQVTGAWAVQQDGDLYTFDATDSGFAAVPKGVSWQGDYAFKASYVLTAGTLAFSFDATTGGRYYVSIDGQRISLVKEDASDNKTVLTQAQAPEIGKQHYITMAKQRGTIQVYVDRTLWLAAQDADPLAAGTVAVGSTGGTTASVDNVLVNKIGRTLPQGTPAVAAVAPAQVVQPGDDDVDLGALPASGDDVPDLADDNHPDDLPAPTVVFAVSVGEGGVSDHVTVPAGTEVTLSWGVENAQEVFFQGAAVGLEVFYPITPVESTVYVLTVVDLGGTEREYTVSVEVTPAEGPGDEAAGHGPDLSVSVTATYEGSGTSANIKMTVSNLGDQDANGAVFRWYAHEADGQVSKTSTVNVAAGHSVSLTFVHDYGQRGTMHWKATIDEDHRLPDTNDGNNVTRGTVTIP